MAKDRVQVGPLARPKPITPTARPVDTYHRPGINPPPRGPSEMDQLMGALSDLQPTINQYAEIKHAENINRQMSEGEKAVLADKRLQNRAALKKAVDAGEIPLARNPWFMQGARQQVYRLQGETFDRDLREAYAGSDARNEDDIAEFVGAYTQKYMEDNQADPSDPEMASILTPAIERSQANLFAHHRAERDRAAEQAVVENTDREIGLLLDRSEELATTPEVAGPMIQQILDENYKNGLSGTVSNEIAAKAIARKAELSLDPSFLDTLDNINTGSGTLGQIGWVKDLRHDTESKIYQQTEHNDRVSQKAHEDATKAASNAGLTEGFQALIDNPTNDIKPILKKLAEVDPKAAQELYSWQQTQINGKDKLNIDEHLEVFMAGEVYEGRGSRKDILAAHGEGLISTPAATKMMENIGREKEYSSIIKNPFISDLHRTLGTTIRGSDANFKEVDAVNASRAQNMFLESMINYRAAHPDADDLELLNYSSDLQQKLIKRFAPEASEDADASMTGVQLTPDTALLTPRENVDWGRRPIYASEADLIRAVQDYNAGIPNSSFEQLAAHLQVEPAVLLRTQAKLLKTPKKK